MAFDVVYYWFPKEADDPAAYEDAFFVDAARKRAAVGDGVSTAMFSKSWAQILTRAMVESPPESTTSESFREWLKPLRTRWNEGIDRPSLGFFQRQKLERGAYSTLLWIEVSEIAGPQSTFQWHCNAIGDCCLFHVRSGKTVGSFPIEHSETLKDDPLCIGSIDLRRDSAYAFRVAEGECMTGDFLVLATDALAAWILRKLEDGQEIQWSKLATMNADQWRHFIIGARSRGAIRHDDTTLILLRIGPGPHSEQLIDSSVAAGNAPDGFFVVTLDEEASSDEDWTCIDSITTSLTRCEFLAEHSGPPDLAMVESAREQNSVSDDTQSPVIQPDDRQGESTCSLHCESDQSSEPPRGDEDRPDDSANQSVKADQQLLSKDAEEDEPCA